MSKMTAAQSLSGEIDNIPTIPINRLYTIIFIVLCAFLNLVSVSFPGEYFSSINNDPMIALKIVATLVGIALPFLLLLRGKYPYLVFFTVAVITLALQLDCVLLTVVLAGVHARGEERNRNFVATIVAFIAAFVSVYVGFLYPPQFSSWATLFVSDQDRVGITDSTLQAFPAAWIGCLLIPSVVLGVGIISGMSMRNNAISKRSLAQAQSERERADTIQTSLSNQQIADSIAAEAHDTLAHSLSLIAVNATSLGVDIEKLRNDPADVRTQEDIEQRAENLRSQAAGALDEAHSIIDMLRHPETAAQILAPGEETALTQESLDALFSDVRNSGTELRLWVDIRGLSALNPNVGKVVFRVVQEGLTNARRHAQEAPVSLSISVIPTSGITVDMTNPDSARAFPSPRVNRTALREKQQKLDNRGGGTGLSGLRSRVEELGGTCKYGWDEHNNFRLSVRLPFVPIS